MADGVKKKKLEIMDTKGIETVKKIISAEFKKIKYLTLFVFLRKTGEGH